MRTSQSRVTGLVNSARQVMTTTGPETVLDRQLTQPWFDHVPVCARRCISLCDRGGDEDFFSCVLPPPPLLLAFHVHQTPAEYVIHVCN